MGVKFFAIILTLILMISGCSADSVTKVDENSLETNKKLTYLMSFPDNLPANVKSFNETYFAKELEKQTGIEVEFINYSNIDDLHIIFASAQIPDIIEANWRTFLGEPDIGIKQGYILKLNDIIENYSPNLKSYLDKNPQIDKMVKTFKGDYYAYPFLRGDERLLTYTGPMIRKDWLDELELSVPKTIDDWSNVLRAFKYQKGCKSPFVSKTNMSLSPFIGAYGVWPEFYIDNGIIKHGAMEQGYENALRLLHSWYQEGLIDKFFGISTDDTNLNAYITSGKSGAFTGLAGSDLGYLLAEMASTNTTFNIEPVPYPVLESGTTPEFAISDNYWSKERGAAITSKCKDIVASAKLLDYGYSEEGSLLFNFGMEGESYTVKNGEVKFTDKILNNPDGLSIRAASSTYSRGSYGGPFVQSFQAIGQYYSLPQQKLSFDMWRTNSQSHLLPFTELNVEEKELYENEKQIKNYIAEQRIFFITGKKPLSEFDMFRKELSSMGIDQIIECYQEMLE